MVARVRRRFDVTSLLTIYVFLLFAVPSSQVFSPLGSAGSPAQILGLVMLALWAVYQIQRSAPTGNGRQPVRTAFFVVAASWTVSFVVAMNRPIAADESSVAITAMVAMCAWCGVLVTVNDGVQDRERFDTLVRRIVLGAACIATIGMLQFFTRTLWVDRLWFPGLSANVNQAAAQLVVRNGLVRPSGTALHPIEFGAVVTMTLPLALTLAMNDRSRSLLRRWTPVALLGFGMMMAGSRSAIVSGCVAVAVLFFSWPPLVKKLAGLVALGFLALVAVALPGVLGGLFGLFAGISQDNSAASRTGSYPLAAEFISRAPLFGRGLWTFLPQYRILDNAWLGMTIEAGLVGTTCFLALLVTGMLTSIHSRKLATDDATRQMGQAIAAGIAAGGCGLAFYDGLAFPMGAAMIFLLLGLSGALHRITVASSPHPPQSPELDILEPSRRFWRFAFLRRRPQLRHPASAPAEHPVPWSGP